MNALYWAAFSQIVSMKMWRPNTEGESILTMILSGLEKYGVYQLMHQGITTNQILSTSQLDYAYLSDQKGKVTRNH